MNPPEFATHWAKELNCNADSLVSLQGGINNYVFRCGNRESYWVIKGYLTSKVGQRNRMQAEVEFLRYANLVAPGTVPELLAVDDKRNCVVLEHLEGEIFTEGMPPNQAAVTSAVNFFRQLNANHSKARHYISMDAAEGFLSLSEHLKNIQNRLDDMQCDHIPAMSKPQAERLLNSMRNKYETIFKITERKISSGEVNDAINPEERCISPSDFGFHNAISTTTGIKFIDFEFSGWDDPVKTVIDFILQPRVPVHERLSPLQASLQLRQPLEFQQRYDALLPILQLKWECIILSILSPHRLARILQKSPAPSTTSLISSRIAAVVSYRQNSNQFHAY